jgi:hypothetical protein
MGLPVEGPAQVLNYSLIKALTVIYKICIFLNLMRFFFFKLYDFLSFRSP